MVSSKQLLARYEVSTKYTLDSELSPKEFKKTGLSAVMRKRLMNSKTGNVPVYRLAGMALKGLEERKGEWKNVYDKVLDDLQLTEKEERRALARYEKELLEQPDKKSGRLNKAAEKYKPDTCSDIKEPIDVAPEPTPPSEQLDIDLQLPSNITEALGNMKFNLKRYAVDQLLFGGNDGIESTILDYYRELLDKKSRKGFSADISVCLYRFTDTTLDEIVNATQQDMLTDYDELIAGLERDILELFEKYNNPKGQLENQTEKQEPIPKVTSTGSPKAQTYCPPYIPLPACTDLADLTKYNLPDEITRPLKNLEGLLRENLPNEAGSITPGIYRVAEQTKKHLKGGNSRLAERMSATVNKKHDFAKGIFGAGGSVSPRNFLQTLTEELELTAVIVGPQKKKSS